MRYDILHSVRARLCAALLAASFLTTSTAAQASIPDLFVTSRFTDQVLRYDGDTGAFLGVFASGGGLSNPVGLTFGPDRNLYVASGNNDRVLRYDGQTGAFLDVFAQGSEMGSPRNLNFGPDGNLYVASGTKDRVLQYDGTTGAFKRVFTIGGTLAGPTSFTFGPDGNLYVASVLTDRVLRYDGSTGFFLGEFITSGVDAPHDVAFGPDGRFYVTSANLTRIKAFDPVTGAFLQNFVSDAALSFPLGMQWDGQRHFYVANQGKNEIRQYHAKSGALLNVIVPPGSGGLDAPLFLAFEPSPAPVVGDAFLSNAGFYNDVRVSGFEPGRRAYLLIGTPMPPVPVLPCGLELGLAAPMVLDVMSLDESGAGVLGGVVPLALAGVTLHLQAISPRSCEWTSVKAITF